MQRFAIFVDAGYLFAGGSDCVFETQKKRSELSLEVEKTIDLLKKKAATLCTSQSSLLRIYWYDGANGNRLSTDQQIIANTNDVKLRLGIINSAGQQKGVDAKIVTDLVELSRNRSISDAVLLGGDEDLRIGIELAQEYGIRAHLLCIDQAGTSPTLKQECDTVTFLKKEEISLILSIREAPPIVTNNNATTIPEVVQQYIDSLSSKDRQDLQQVLSTPSASIPREHDGKLLGKARDALGGDLTPDEKKELRSEFKKIIGATP